MTKKSVLLACGLVLSLAALSGCGKKDESSAAAEKAPSGGKESAAAAHPDHKEPPKGVLTAAPGAGQDAPAVPTSNSGPPTAAEWEAAAQVNTTGPNTAPKDCTMKMVREWLKVNCTGSIKQVSNMEGFGHKGTDYFELITPGKVADLVVKVKKGGSLKARIMREGPHSASLFVNWPGQLDKPSIIALAIYNGPPLMAASPSLQPGLLSAGLLAQALSSSRFTARPGLRCGLGA